VEYQVRFDLPSGFDSFTAREAGSDETVDSNVDGGGLSRVVVLGPGEDDPTIDAGVFQFGAQATASLGDRLFHDLDADGVQDAGEPGIGGSTVTLLADTDNDGQVDDPLATTTTADGTGADPAGFYRFDDLAPDAAYRVEFALPSGFDSFTARDAGSDDTIDSDVDAAGLSQVVTLDADEFDPTIDAGVFNTAALGDFVFEDLDGDGLQDANEPGVGGVTVTLSGAGPDGLLDTSDDTTAQQLTDGDGEYLFEGLTPGEPYRVNFSGLPAGFSFTAPDAGDEAADSDADLASGDAPAVTLASGERDLTIDAGILAPAGLGDFVWRDADADGVQDAGEPGIAGVVVELLDANDQVIAATTTDGSGLYRFTGLEPGTYSTRVAAGNFDAGQPLEDLFITKLDAGLDDAVDSDGDPAEALAAAATTLVSGQFDPTLDFGFFATGIELVKAGPETAIAGETIEYEFTVTNTGDVALGGVVVDDPLLSGSPIVVGERPASLGLADRCGRSRRGRIPRRDRGLHGPRRGGPGRHRLRGRRGRRVAGGRRCHRRRVRGLRLDGDDGQPVEPAGDDLRLVEPDGRRLRPGHAQRRLRRAGRRFRRLIRHGRRKQPRPRQHPHHLRGRRQRRPSSSPRTATAATPTTTRAAGRSPSSSTPPASSIRSTSSTSIPTSRAARSRPTTPTASCSRRARS